MTLPCRLDCPPMYRYAVYFCPPPKSPLGWAGRHWLGRCAEEGVSLRPLSIASVTAQQLLQLTQAPRRYGWHATLKAPFVLAAGFERATLSQHIQKIASCFDPFDIEALELTILDGFLALVPVGKNRTLNALANRLSLELQGLAEELSESDIVRRRKSVLSPRQDQLMQCWGYPYVLEQYRFHFSLTSDLSQEHDGIKRALQHAAQIQFGQLGPFTIDQVCLSGQPSPGANFQVLERLLLGGLKRRDEIKQASVSHMSRPIENF
jgi:hypothetical protein